MFSNYWIIIIILISSKLINANILSVSYSVDKLINYPKFDGIGAISGGGATSKLLQTYKEPYKSQILDYLFKPQFGSSLHLLKVEIGGDSQSTEGTEASHSHYEWEVNCNRGYEWQLIVEAKKRNPSILLYGLAWAFPGWVSNFTGNPYHLPNKLANYTINWLKCGRNTYNVEFQYIGLWNEKRYDIVYIKTLRETLDKEGFPNVKIIGADIKWEIASDIIKDSELSNCIYAIGCHYPGTYSSDIAKISGKPLWSSEDFSTSNIEKGAGCWARILNQNYVNGNMTSTIAWNLIAAYYDDLPYSRCGLMTAIEPWSGNYDVPATVWITAHTTQFTQPGWKYAPVGKGSGHFSGGGSYVTLIDPQMKNLTIILENMSHDNSVCIRPSLPPFNAKDQNITVKFDPYTVKLFHQFFLWRTDLSSNNPSKIFHLEKVVQPDSAGEIKFVLPVDHVVTLSTISTGNKSVHPPPPAPKSFPSDYSDDFQNYPINAEPDLLVPQVGSFEVGTLGSSTKKILVQTVIDQPISWCFDPPINTRPIAVIGNFNKSDMVLSVMAMVPSLRPVNSVFLGSRINNSGCTTFLAGGVFFWLNFTSSEFLISTDINSEKIYYRHKINLAYNQWYNMSIVLREDNGWFYVDDKLVCEITNLYDRSPIHGFAGLGTDMFGLAYFDDFKMKLI